MKDVCSCERSNYHNVNNDSIKTKAEKSDYFLAAKHQGQYHLFLIQTQLSPCFCPFLELAKKTWPQFMCMEASGIVSPNNHSYDYL